MTDENKKRLIKVIGSLFYNQSLTVEEAADAVCEAVKLACEINNPPKVIDCHQGPEWAKAQERPKCERCEVRRRDAWDMDNTDWHDNNFCPECGHLLKKDD